MAAVESDKSKADDIISKPNRAAIVLAIGEKGELSFKDLKAKMNLGVGTLYYHLDGLKGFVAQNGSKKYVLTVEGKGVYDKIRATEGAGKPSPRVRVPSLKAALGEIFLFDSHVERLSIDSMSNLSITFGILLTASVLAGVTRIYDAMFFIQGRLAAPSLAFLAVIGSWSILFGLSVLLPRLIWRSSLSLPGLAGGSALSMVPVMFPMVLEGLRRTFAPSLDFLGNLYMHPWYLVFQGVLVIWAAYIYAVSLRSATNLNLEKALVVTLFVVLINLGYFWGRPLLLGTR
jgi:hypothetical protein